MSALSPSLATLKPLPRTNVSLSSETISSRSAPTSLSLKKCWRWRVRFRSDVGLVALARHLEAVAAHERLVEQRDHLVALGADLAVAEEMLALARALPI